MAIVDGQKEILAYLKKGILRELMQLKIFLIGVKN